MGICGALYFIGSGLAGVIWSIVSDKIGRKKRKHNFSSLVRSKEEERGSQVQFGDVLFPYRFGFFV